jgi:hypothetical protein
MCKNLFAGDALLCEDEIVCGEHIAWFRGDYISKAQYDEDTASGKREPNYGLGFVVANDKWVLDCYDACMKGLQ